MRALLYSTIFALGALTACADPGTKEHVNALTGESCEPNAATYIPHDPGPCQGTTNGDNCDDLHSGKIDCIGDGNSGQGDDKKHNCEFPQPGCDDTGCCDDDLVEPPVDDTPPPEEEPLPDIN